jgi:hypothetical protein
VELGTVAGGIVEVDCCPVAAALVAGIDVVADAVSEVGSAQLDAVKPVAIASTRTIEARDGGNLISPPSAQRDP